MTTAARRTVTRIDLSAVPPTGTPALPEPRPVLSVAEAADLLGVSQWLLLQQIRLGTIPHKRCGRRIVFSRERLMEWLNGDS